MTNCYENMDADCCEYRFATELMSSVMELYYVKWKPNTLHSNENQSLFSPVIKKAVEYIWTEKKEFIEDLFDTVIQLGTINMRNYKSAVEYASHLVTEAEYDEIELLRYCVIASGYASLFYISGLKDVPNQCIKCIYNTIMSFRLNNQFTDKSWYDIEILGEAYSVGPAFKEDFSKSTSACSNQVSPNESSDNILHTEVYSKNVENKYSSKTLDRNSTSPMQKYCKYLKEHTIENENEKDPLKLPEPRNINSKFEKSQSNNKKTVDLKVVNKQVSGKGIQQTFLGNKITTRSLTRTHEYITLDVEDKHKDDTILNSLNVKHVKSKTKKNTDKFKANDTADTFNKYKEIAIKRSKACNNLEKENLQISNNVEIFNSSKDDETISQTENINMVVYKTKKSIISEQETKQEHSKFCNTSKITNVVKADKYKNTKIFGKSYKNIKYQFSKSKLFKANKNTRYAGVCKRLTETNENEDIEYLSDETQETNKTFTEAAETENSVEDALIIKDTDTDKKVRRIKIKSRKTKHTKHNTKSDMNKTKNAASAIKRLRNKENNSTPGNSAKIISENMELKCKVSKVKRVRKK